MPKSASAPKQSETLPRDVAFMALEACDGIIGDAVDWAFDWMRTNKEWLAQHHDAMARDWIGHHIGRARNDQGRIATGTRASSDSSSVVPFQSALTEAVNANYSRMMDAPIWGGKKIGDATPQEIRDSAHLFAENGKTMLRKSAWQNAVADAAEKNGAGINEPVRKVLSPKTFEQLWEESDAA